MSLGATCRHGTPRADPSYPTTPLVPDSGRCDEATTARRTPGSVPDHRPAVAPPLHRWPGAECAPHERGVKWLHDDPHEPGGCRPARRDPAAPPAGAARSAPRARQRSPRRRRAGPARRHDAPGRGRPWRCDVRPDRRHDPHNRRRSRRSSRRAPSWRHRMAPAHRRQGRQTRRHPPQPMGRRSPRPRPRRASGRRRRGPGSRHRPVRRTGRRTRRRRRRARGRTPVHPRTRHGERRRRHPRRRRRHHRHAQHRARTLHAAGVPALGRAPRLHLHRSRVAPGATTDRAPPGAGKSTPRAPSPGRRPRRTTRRASLGPARNSVSRARPRRGADGDGRLRRSAPARSATR